MIKARDLLSVIISNFSYVTFSFVSFLSSLHSKISYFFQSFHEYCVLCRFLLHCTGLVALQYHELNLTSLFRFILAQYQWLQWLFWLQNHAWATEIETCFQMCFNRTCHILGCIVDSIYELTLREGATVMKLKISHEEEGSYLFM